MTAKEEKQRAIDELTKEQVKWLKKSSAIAKLPQPKRASTAIKRACKVVGYAINKIAGDILEEREETVNLKIFLSEYKKIKNQLTDVLNN